MLGSGRLFSVAEMARLQNDDLSIPARALVPLLKDVDVASPASARARDLLIGWDFVMDKASVPAGIYGMWQRRLFGQRSRGDDAGGRAREPSAQNFALGQA